MAFFSGLSSSIGRKLLLYGLRQIDILDKDPADFVSVDVGKRTTLEVRDVGLHVKVGLGRRFVDLHILTWLSRNLLPSSISISLPKYNFRKPEPRCYASHSSSTLACHKYRLR